MFVQDLFGGADPAYRLPVRFITPNAWHALFVRNMFIRALPAELAAVPARLHRAPRPRLPGRSRPARHPDRHVHRAALRQEAGADRRHPVRGRDEEVDLHRAQLPAAGPGRAARCTARPTSGPRGDTAIFFGLSGTGKTTLSADPTRQLIGDDEHGWSDRGVFNFEGGCYAKVIRLRPETEPEIYAATQMFGTVLENVVVDPATRAVDFDADTITENTRACYPIHYIPNHLPSGAGGHPKNIVFLTADAFGVMPPIARLTADQAMYHFLSGYTAKVAGTERGVTEPSATFSACFGAPFLPAAPGRVRQDAGRADRQARRQGLAGEHRLDRRAYGTGSRMKLPHTRAMVRAALAGALDQGQFAKDPVFGFEVPTAVPDVPAEVLSPRGPGPTRRRTTRRPRKLATMFRENFEQYRPRCRIRGGSSRTGRRTRERSGHGEPSDR